VGRGTALLAEKEKGDKLNLLGPLGRGFTIPVAAKRYLSWLAGSASPPFIFPAELSRLKIYADVFLGAATNRQMFFASEIKALGHNVFPATDDGTAGHHGTVVDLFNQHPADRVYACGPAGMLKNLCQTIKIRKIVGEISLEERMGCGVGACLSCACKTAGGGENYRYRRVCVDGPVFPAGEVVWE
jgi:dihydroorotate dehydrogenase electron transfer subunit